MTSPPDGAPVRYAEPGSTWWPATWGIVFSLTGAGVEALSGPVHVVVWVLAGIGLSGLTLIWVQARRRVFSLRLTVDTLYQGREPLPVDRIAELDDVGPPIGARVLGGGWTVPKKFTEVPLRLADGTVVLGWAKNPDAFRAALRPLLTAGH
jgi:hypothetical protein